MACRLPPAASAPPSEPSTEATDATREREAKAARTEDSKGTDGRGQSSGNGKGGPATLVSRDHREPARRAKNPAGIGARAQALDGAIAADGKIRTGRSTVDQVAVIPIRT